MEFNESLLDVEGVKRSRKPLIDLFIRRTSVLTSTPEELVDKIIRDQWRNANKVTQANSPIKEIDFCNIGTFYISENKAKKRIKKLEMYNRLIDEEGTTLKNQELVKERNRATINSIRIKTKLVDESRD